jgi:uncharacterized Zn-finger protein
MNGQGKTTRQSNVHTHYEVSRKELPVHCPPPGSTLWNSHPRVYLPLGEVAFARCPYCGAEYVLKN